MRLKRLVLKNWCCHKELDIEFRAGVVGVVGQNGAGKSAILDAIAWLDTGDFASYGNKGDNLTNGEKSGFGFLEFDHAGHAYSVRRSIDTPRVTLDGPLGKLTSKTEVERMLDSLFGSTSDARRQNIYVPQGRIDSILFKTNVERFKEFQDAFGLGKAEEVWRELGLEINSFPVTVGLKEQLGQAVQQYEDAGKEVELLVGRLVQLESSIAELIPFEQQLRDSMAAMSRVKALEDAEKNVQLYTVKCAETEAEVTRLTLVVQKGESALVVVSSQAQEARQVLAEIAAAKRMQLQQESIRQRIAKCDETLSVATPGDEEVAALDARCAELAEEIQKKQIALRDLQREVKAFETGVCPTCGQTVPKGTDLENRRKQQADLREAMTALQSSLVQGQEQQRRNAEILRKASLARSEKDSLEQQLSDIPLLPDEDEAELQAIVVKHTTVQAKVGQLKADLQTAQRMLQAHRDAFMKADELRQTYSDSLHIIQPEELAQLKEKVDLLNVRFAERTKVASDKEVAEVRQEQYSRAIDDLRARHDKEAATADWVGICRRAREIVHATALPAAVMRDCSKILNRRLSYYLDLWEAPFSMQLDEDLNFIAEFPDGRKHAAARLSGGQKVVASVSFRLAMADTFAKDFGLLVLDEPSVYLDKANLQHLQTLILRLKTFAGETGRQIVLVTHEEALMGYFDHAIRLGRKD